MTGTGPACEVTMDGDTRIFTLAEANATLPGLVRLTRRVIARIDRVRRRYGLGESNPELPETALREVEELLQGWSARVAALGAMPKGYFTVDFQSMDPSLLYCWTYGEETIAYTHRTWENFSHRRPLLEAMQAEGEYSRWVN